MAKTGYTRFNYDTATEQQKANALARNQRIAAQRAAAFAKSRAGGVQALGQAAARGGMFADLSAAPGFQNFQTGAISRLLAGGVSGPAQAALRGANILYRLRMANPYQMALKKLDEDTTGGYGGYVAGGPTPVGTQPIL